jgi:hypothetical protein
MMRNAWRKTAHDWFLGEPRGGDAAVTVDEDVDEEHNDFDKLLDDEEYDYEEGDADDDDADDDDADDDDADDDNADDDDDAVDDYDVLIN